MQNLTLLKKLQRSRQRAVTKTELHLRFSIISGFTLIEVLVVVLMMGVLAAIAAPGWLTFVARQRVNKASDAVLGALQEGQREAKRTKLSYSVSFKSVQNEVPQVAIYPMPSATTQSSAPALTDNHWKNLGGDLDLQSNQVLVYTNIDNKTSNSVAAGSPTVAGNLVPNVPTITFDYMGALLSPNFGTTNQGLKVVVADARSGSSLAAATVKRCIIVETLIGGMRTAKDSDCN